MRRIVDIVLTGMAMLAVALLSAFAAMRIAIHGHEVEVPVLTGLTVAEASRTAASLGLSLQLENRFYSTTTPSGHLLGQFPAPGATVRREWPIRITESLGPQQVSIPDLVGEQERPAALALRKASLEVGSVASIPAPGEAGLVLAQTPPPNAEGVDRPSVSLLLSAPAAAAPEAFVAPSFAGLSFGAAQTRAAAMGLRVYAVVEALPAPAGLATAPAASVPGQTATPAAPPPSSAPPPSLSGALVLGQSPQAGHRVVHNEAIRLILAH